MSLFDGIVTVEDNQVPVIIGLEEDRIRMSSGGAEIGEWVEGEYSIDQDGDGSYTITAEDESLRFVPTNPALFAAGLHMEPPAPPSTPNGHPEQASGARPPIPQGTDDRDVPEPKTITLGVFYALAGLTAMLGLWALVSLLV